MYDTTKLVKLAALKELAECTFPFLASASWYYKGVDMTQKFASEIAAAPYSGDPWAWIQARIQAGDFAGIRVDDYIPFTTTNNVTLDACVSGINTYKGYGDTAVGNHIDFVSRELWPIRKPINPVNYNNGLIPVETITGTGTEYPWLASDMYHWLNSLAGQVPNSTGLNPDAKHVDYTQDGVYYYLPDNLKAVIVEKRACLPKRYSESGLLSNDNAYGWENIGKLWLPSECEVYGAPCWGGKNGYSTMGNNVQYPSFAHNMNRLKYRSGSRGSWWLLSADAGNAGNWCYVASDGHAASSIASLSIVGAPVCFRVA